MREDVASFLSDYIEELIVPEILSKQRGEHLVRFAGSLDDIQRFDNLLADNAVENFGYQRLQATGFWVDDTTKEDFKQSVLDQLKQAQLVRSVKIPKAFFKGILDDVSVEYDNQNINIPLEAQNLLSLITAIGANPNLITDPVTRKLMYRYAELIGVSPVELELARENQPQQEQMLQQLGQLGQVTQGENELQTRPIPAGQGGLAQPVAI
jgi:hypothetical protein